MTTGVNSGVIESVLNSDSKNLALDWQRRENARKKDETTKKKLSKHQRRRERHLKSIEKLYNRARRTKLRASNRLSNYNDFTGMDGSSLDYLEQSMSEVSLGFKEEESGATSPILDDYDNMSVDSLTFDSPDCESYPVSPSNFSIEVQRVELPSGGSKLSTSFIAMERDPV
ncbi:hypothetical protein PCE1_002727 [Barthelona sp. PCE]